MRHNIQYTRRVVSSNGQSQVSWRQITWFESEWSMTFSPCLDRPVRSAFFVIKPYQTSKCFSLSHTPASILSCYLPSPYSFFNDVRVHRFEDLSVQLYKLLFYLSEIFYNLIEVQAFKDFSIFFSLDPTNSRKEIWRFLLLSLSFSFWVIFITVYR